MKRVFLIGMVLMLSACSSAFSSGRSPVLHSQLDPKNVPVQRDVSGRLQPVLLLTVLALDAGYSIEKSVIVTGAPSEAIDQDREVLVTAQGANGEVIARVSVFNPREIHTAGAKKPERAVLDKGSFTVALPRPELIKTIDIEVRRGPNASLKKTFIAKERPAAQAEKGDMLFVPR